jgi:hypothetical protein
VVDVPMMGVARRFCVTQIKLRRVAYTLETITKHHPDNVHAVVRRLLAEGQQVRHRRRQQAVEVPVAVSERS